MKMPGLKEKSGDNVVCANGFWSKDRDEISFSYLQKFWGELSPQARQDLLKINKRSILEQARNNMYCSRCNGLLLECFMQIVMFENTSQADGTSGFHLGRRCGGLSKQGGVLSNLSSDSHDPALHPWGGLTTAKDEMLTVLSTYIHSKSLTGLQNVFDSARARERERELLYPDACGGGGRGWISQGIPSYGRWHGTREACALHTARLSCDTLVDFWSALGEETRHSLLRMKEEDFIERLMYRFDSKRFCRDCRKNVIREFKVLKELKRTKREARCTHSFCSANSIIQCEVFDESIRADWRQAFMDSDGVYHHFEWAVGTGEGKSDILAFENVGTSKVVNVDGLDLGGLSAFYINLKACKLEGKPSEFSVKAHALKGQECVHSRLVVGDGFVTITKGESIRRFFEHAEEVEEEEEDDDTMDKDGNDVDGECSRPQKHAKSPELAREFLLDAATVIFKEQVEKAFREGTARQNAHSVFVCLVLKLLEERVHVACKEIITLEKQTKLLQEEEKEKFEEEERKEKRRMKEREKKQRRKERLKEKDGDNDKEASYSNSNSVHHTVLKDDHSSIDDEEINFGNDGDSPTELTTGRPSSPNIQDQITEISSDCYSSSESRDHCHSVVTDSGEITSAQDDCGYTTSEHSEYSFHGDKFWKYDASGSVSKSADRQQPQHLSGNSHIYTKSEFRDQNNKLETYSKRVNGLLSRQFRDNGAQARSCATKHGSEKFHSGSSRKGEQCNSYCCTCIPDYQTNSGSKVETAILCSEDDCEFKSDKVREFHYGTKNNQSDHLHNSSARSHSKSSFGNNRSRDKLHNKMVWEPMNSQKKYARRNSDSDIAKLSSSLNVDGSEPFNNQSSSATDSSDENVASQKSESCSGKTSHVRDLDCDKVNSDTFSGKMHPDSSGVLLDNEVDASLNDSCDVAVGSYSNSEQPHLNLCGGNNNMTSSRSQILTITTSDSKGASQFTGNKEISSCLRSKSAGHRGQIMEKKPELAEAIKNDTQTPGKSTLNTERVANSFVSSELPVRLALPLNQTFPFPMFHHAPSTIDYYQPNTIIWPSAPANGLIAMPRLNPYVVSSPLNYGWSGTPGICMPYGGVTHMEPPLFSQGQVPVYHSVSNATGMHPEEQVKISKPTLAQDVSFQVHNKMQLVPGAPNGRTATKPDPESIHIGKENNNGFSLFHFGGPVALSSTLKEGKIDELALKSSVAHGVEVDHIYNKKEAYIEEYSLFAASNNGFKFSF